MKITKYRIVLIIMAAFLLSCSTKQNDPLKNTKKFVTESHVSLYKNGAFQVSETSIYLIPKGPEAIEFIAEMAGLRARKSFLLSLKRAAESVYIVSEGTKLSWNTAAKIHHYTDDLSDQIRNKSKDKRVLLVKRSSELAKDISLSSWAFSKQLANEMNDIGERIVVNSLKTGDNISDSGSKAGTDLIKNSIEFSRDFSRARNKNAKKTILAAKNNFIAAYIAVPGRLKENTIKAGANTGKANPFAIIGENNSWRIEYSEKNTDMIGETALAYKDNSEKSLSRIEKEFLESYKDTGVAFATLKALRWALQSAFWDLTLEPLAEMFAGSVGYIGVNLVAFPVMVVKDEAGAIARIAVDLVWNTSKSAYHLTAPSAEAALASVFSCFELTAGNIIAGSAAMGGVFAGVTEKGAAKTGSLAFKGGGRALGKTIQYIGVPLAAVGVAGGKTVGVAVEGSGKLSFGAIFVTGGLIAGGTDVFGNLIAGTTLVAGTSGATAAGTAYSAYQLSKAVAVPAGYELGAGIVLSYDTMAHIAAQSILAVADCSYLVLSLEGPRWVIYAVKGNTGNGDDLLPGTVLDMGKMHKSGEAIYNLPVSDDEMKKVVKSLYETLPAGYTATAYK